MSTISWEESYLGQLRKLIGRKKIIHPSVRAIIQDEKGRVLFIERKVENRWGMPAGSMELDESIFETLEREVAEFFSLDDIPQGSNEFWDNHHKEVFDDLRNFKGQLILK
jgi:hypothetical protein